MRTVAVIGANGFVGSAVCAEIEKRQDLRLVRIVRGDDLGKLLEKAEVVIHAANPAKRFFAEKNPEADFAETVEKTKKIKESARGKKMILISTVSARLQLNTVYGRNRLACEELMDKKKDLIVRLGPMFGEGKEVGALHDLLNNRPCYIDGRTKYAYVNVKYNARKIVDLMGRTGMIELGARNAIALEELRDLLGSSSQFTGPDDSQIPVSPPEDAPDARDIIAFALNLKKVMK